MGRPDERLDQPMFNGMRLESDSGKEEIRKKLKKRDAYGYRKILCATTIW
jgi:hypothetical protein